MMVAGAVVVAAVVVAAVALMTRRVPAPVQLGRRTPVTTDPGLELDAALSPDGKLVAYSAAQGALTVRQVEGGAPVQVLRSDDIRGRWPAWLPDGQRLVFISPRGIEIVSALGGAPRLLVAGSQLDRGVTVAPDGQTFAYVSHDSLFAAPLNGGPPRLVAHGYEVHSPAWSPDGQWIAFVQGDQQYISLTDLGNLAETSIWLAPSRGGAAHRVTDARAMHASPAWISAQSLLFVSDAEGGRDVYQLSLTSDGLPKTRACAHNDGSEPARHQRLAGRQTPRVFGIHGNVERLVVACSGRRRRFGVDCRAGDARHQIIENIGVSNDGKWLGFSAGRGGTSQVYRVRRDVKGARAAAGDVRFDATPTGPRGRPMGRRSRFIASLASDVRSSWRPSREVWQYRSPMAREDERTPEWSPDGQQLLLLASWGTNPALHVVKRGSDGRWSKPRVLPIVVAGEAHPNWNRGLVTGRTLRCVRMRRGRNRDRACRRRPRAAAVVAFLDRGLGVPAVVGRRTHGLSRVGGLWPRRRHRRCSGGRRRCTRGRALRRRDATVASLRLSYSRGADLPDVRRPRKRRVGR